MTTTTKRRPMTPQQATSFNKYSVANAGQVQARLKCGCEPYKDVFTYNRWRAQGYQVMRGQKAIKLPIIIEDKNEDGEVTRRFWTAAVFCRHQVKAIGVPEPESPTPDGLVTEQAQRVADKLGKPIAIEPAGIHAEPKVTQPDIMKGWRLI